jgi:hypothetical protein
MVVVGEPSLMIHIARVGGRGLVAWRGDACEMDGKKAMGAGEMGGKKAMGAGECGRV